jgi:hypothetical protein
MQDLYLPQWLHSIACYSGCTSHVLQQTRRADLPPAAASSSPCRQAGQLDSSVETFEQLFEVAVEHNGLQNQQTILLAKTISDLYEEMEQPGERA